MPNLIQVKRTAVAGRAANTTTLPEVGGLAVNILDQILYSGNGSVIFEVGANIANQVIRGNVSIGNSSVNTTANSTNINTATIQTSTSVFVGANVDLTTAGLFIGDASTNLFANSTILKLANSTVNTGIAVPTAAQYAGSYYLHANGTWQLVAAGATPGGANTQVQFNDSTALGGSAGFTFDKTTNNVVIANTLSLGANVVVNTSTMTVGNTTANHTANSTAVQVMNATGIAQMFPQSFYAGNGGTQILPTGGTLFWGGNNNTFTIIGTAAAAVPYVMVSNASGSANHYSNGFIVGSSVINSTAIAEGANVQLTTTQLAIGNTVANSFQNSVLLQVSNSTATSNLQPGQLAIGASLVNTSTLVVGNFTANTLLANAAALNVVGQTNTGTLFAATSANVGTNVQLTTTQLTIGNTIANAFANSTLLQVANSLSTANLKPFELRIGNLGAVVNDSFSISAGNSTVWAAFSFTNPTLPYVAVANSLSVGQLTSTTLSLGGAAATSNAIVNTTMLYITNPTGNAVLTPASLTLNAVSATTNGFSAAPNLLQIGNTSISANHTPTGFVVGTSTVNATTLIAGNFTANTLLANAVALNVINQTNTGTLQTTGAATVGTTLAAGNTTVTGFVNATVSVNSALLSVGTTFTANSILANAAALNVVGQTNTGTLFAATSANVGANVQLTTAQLTIGNTTANHVANSIILYLTNSTANAVLTPTSLTLNAVSATTNGFSAGPALLQIGNTSVSANHTPTGFVVGTSTVNATTLIAGNFTANTLLANAVALNVINQTNTGTLQTTGAATVGTTLAVGNTTVTGFVNATVSVNSALLSVGTTFTANSILANAAALNVVNQTNTGTFFAATSANVGANVQLTTISLSIGNSTINTFANSSQLRLTGSVSANGATGTSLQALLSNSTGGVYWGTPTAAATPGGSTTQVQFNDAGTMQGDPGLTFDKVNDALTVANTMTVGNSSVNVATNTSSIYIGNTTVNGTANAVFLGLSNSTYSANLTPRDLTIGNTQVNGAGISIGATAVNAYINAVFISLSNSSGTANLAPTNLTIGNTVVSTASITIGVSATANITANSTLVQVANSTATANLTPLGLAVGASVVNTLGLTVGTSVVNSTLHAAGANNILSLTGLQLGNSTVNTLANSTTVLVSQAGLFTQMNSGYFYAGNGGTQILPTAGTLFWGGNNNTYAIIGTATPTTPYLQVANSSGSANLTPIGLVSGTSVINSTAVSAALLTTGAAFTANSTLVNCNALTVPQTGVLTWTSGPTITGAAGLLTVAGGGVKAFVGNSTVAPLTLQSGTNLTTAAAGAFEYDGVQFYNTISAAEGRAAVPDEQYFHLTANGGNISTIANFFGTTSNPTLVASAYYIIDIYMWFLKNTTAETITWSLINSAAPTSQNILFEMSPINAMVAPPGTATMLVGQVFNDATATKTILTGSLSIGATFYTHIKIWLKNGTGTSLKIQVANPAATLTPLMGSHWHCRRISPNNIGTFAA